MPPGAPPRAASARRTERSGSSIRESWQAATIRYRPDLALPGVDDLGDRTLLAFGSGFRRIDDELALRIERPYVARLRLHAVGIRLDTGDDKAIGLPGRLGQNDDLRAVRRH